MVAWSPNRVNSGLAGGLTVAFEKKPCHGHILRKYFAQFGFGGLGSTSMSFKIHEEVLVFYSFEDM